MRRPFASALTALLLAAPAACAALPNGAAAAAFTAQPSVADYTELEQQ